VSPAQTLVVPVVATTVLPDSISRAAASGNSYCAIFNVSVAGEDPVFVALAYTVDPETISAISPAGTLATLTTLLVVS
jgi:hypothetical protein